jgi:hypothetical protein
MSTLMSLELIPSNDLLSYAPVFERHAVLATVSLTEQERAAATRYLDRNAPDLMGMILGVAA